MKQTVAFKKSLLKVEKLLFVKRLKKKFITPFLTRKSNKANRKTMKFTEQEKIGQSAKNLKTDVQLVSRTKIITHNGDDQNNFG